MGVIRLSVEEFRQMTPDEFDAVSSAYNKYHEDKLHDGWERMRMLASICIQPHVRKRVSAKDLIKFPWDEKPHEKQPIASKEEAQRQLDDLLRRLKEKEDNGKE